MKAPQILIPTQSSEKQIDYNEIYLDENDTEEQKKAKIEMYIGKALCAELAKHYPLRNWSAGADISNGIVVILCPDVSREKGYHIHLTRSMNEIRAMMPRVGGEILERAGVSRNKKFNVDELDLLDRTVRDEVSNVDMISPEERYAKKQRSV